MYLPLALEELHPCVIRYYNLSYVGRLLRLIKEHMSSQKRLVVAVIASFGIGDGAGRRDFGVGPGDGSWILAPSDPASLSQRHSSRLRLSLTHTRV